MRRADAAARPNRGRRLFLITLFVLSLLTLALGVWRWWLGRQQIAAQSQPAALGEPARAPDFELATPDGDLIRLADLRGKVVLLNFWATWCPPCRAEMPDLEALYREYGDREGFTVVGVDNMETAAQVADFARQNHLSFPLVLDPDGRVANAFDVRYLPVSVLIDPQGYIRDTWRGQIAREAMLARVRKAQQRS